MGQSFSELTTGIGSEATIMGQAAEACSKWYTFEEGVDRLDTSRVRVKSLSHEDLKA
jgi:hypothetical protein